MLTKNFQRLEAEVTAHVNADRVAQGSYKTCFIGCLANGHDDPEFIENGYGIPFMVTRIAESIFEGLPADKAPSFFAAIPQAIGSDGKDLALVGWKFLAEELRSLPLTSDDIQACIDPVIDGIDLLAGGKEWPDAASASATARATATATAAWAADAAARAATAAWSASAAWSATSARAAASATATWSATATRAAAWADAAASRLRQRDTLLRLIKEAPITQKEDS